MDLRKRSSSLAFSRCIRCERVSRVTRVASLIFDHPRTGSDAHECDATLIGPVTSCAIRRSRGVWPHSRMHVGEVAGRPPHGPRH